MRLKLNSDETLTTTHKSLILPKLESTAYSCALFLLLFPSSRGVLVILLLFDKRCLSVMHPFSVTSAKVSINHILLKARFFGLHFCCRQYRYILRASGNRGYEVVTILKDKGQRSRSRGQSSRSQRNVKYEQ